MKPQWKVKIGKFLLATSIILWPLTSLTVARDEPQFVLGLSWLAIILTALDYTEIAKVQEDNEKNGEGN